MVTVHYTPGEFAIPQNLLQMGQWVRDQLHARVPLLDALEPQQASLAHLFPRPGPLETGSHVCMAALHSRLRPRLVVLRLRGFSLRLGIIPALDSGKQAHTPT